MVAIQSGPKHLPTREILIVDDHPVLRRGLAALIESEPDLSVCGEAASSQEALALVGALNPDIAIVDLTLSDGDGLDVVKSMNARYPEVPTLVLSMHDEAVYAERSLRAGAKGYVMKQELDDTVIAAIRCVLAGEMYMSAALKSHLAAKYVGGKTLATDSLLDVLSDRELQVFELIGRGVGTREIATRLHLSVKTIESHLERIKHKLKLESAVALAHSATRWIESGHPG